MSPLVSLAVHIKVPPEAVVPLLVGSAALFALTLGGAALKDWKARQPKAATTTALVLALGLTGYAVYAMAMVWNTKYIDHGAPGADVIGFFDGPIIGFCALIGAIFWGFANKRWPPRIVGIGLGLALFVKPFVLPLHSYWDGHEHPWHFIDPEHLSFHGPGLVAMIGGLIAGARGRS